MYISKKINTVNSFILWTYKKFKNSNIFYGHGTDNALDEASYLVLSALNIPFYMPKNNYNQYINVQQKLQLIKLVKKRIYNRIPVAYLVNQAWFCNKKFYVDKRVIIPRSPIAELINKKFLPFIKYKPNNILDLCTGSGCIAISCAFIFSNTIIEASDISEKALQIARLNINIHKMNNRINVIKSNIFKKIKNKYDMIISNPPYVSLNNIKKLPQEYLYEPIISLGTNKDSLSIIKKIIFFAKYYLTDRGILICEIGENNINKLIKYFKNIKFKFIQFKNGGTGVFLLKKNQLKNIYIR